MRNQKGFTLVEAVVVAAIIAILAAIAIPSYLGYVQSSQIDSAQSSSELIGAAVIQTHNRGININASNFGDIGITSPSNNDWTFTFAALAPASAMGVSYTITATSAKYGTYVFKPRETGSARWQKQ